VERETELTLVGRLRHGEAAAFDEIYAAFHKPLFTFLIRLSRQRDVAEDLHEETWLRLVKHAARLRGDTRLGPWLFTVARNLHVSYRRSRALEDSAAAGLAGLWPVSVRETSPFEETDCTIARMPIGRDSRVRVLTVKTSWGAPSHAAE